MRRSLDSALLRSGWQHCWLSYAAKQQFIAASQKTKRPLLNSRGQEIPVVPPQFTAIGGLMGAKQPLERYRALPVRTYCGSARPLRKEFHIPSITALHPPAALWDVLMNMYWFSSTCFVYLFFCSSIVYHHMPHKSIKKAKNISMETHLFFKEQLGQKLQN